MEKIFVYYSKTGNGDIVSESLKDKGFEIEKIETRKPLLKNKFLSIMQGGFLAAIKSKTKIKDLCNDLNKYDSIVIGSPIWNGRISSPINTILSNYDLSQKKLTFVFYSASGEGTKALERVNKEYPNAKVIILKEPKANALELEKILEI